MGKVYVYQRVSTDEQNMLSQDEQISRWLTTHGMTSDETVSEEGVSGSVSYRKRNLGTQIIPKLQRGDTLIVSEISRLGRSMSDINVLVNKELKPRGVRLVVVQSGIDLNCAELRAIDEMLLFAFSFGAQVERELIQSRTKAALDARKKKLQEEGSFVSKKGNVVTRLGRPRGCDNDTTAALRTIHERNINDQNKIIIYETIKDAETKQGKELAAEKLNRMGIKTDTGLPFTYARVGYTRTRYMRMFNHDYYKQYYTNG